MIKYEFPKGKIKPTFQTGCFVNYSFLTNYERNLEVKTSINDNTIYTKKYSDNPFNKYNIGLNFGIGLTGTYKNDNELFLDLRYQKGTSFYFGLDANTIILNAGFQIGK
jgi:hypothetical protein